MASSQPLPTWYKDALRQDIDYIILVYEKAEGFIFCPKNLEKPFRVGGDYDGNWPVSAEGALEHYWGFFNRHFESRVAWFIPFVEKVYLEEDFSLADLDIEKRDLRTIRGRWPW